MVRFFVLILAVIILAASACSKKAANADSNANAETEIQTATFTDANEALAEGNRLLDENQTQAAIDALRQAVKLNPDLAEAYFKLGIAYSLQELEQQQNGIVTDQPASGNKEGRVKSNSEKAFDKAVVAYKKWLDANPGDDVAWFNLGRTHYKLGDVDQAEKAIGKAAKLKPDDAEYQTEWGAILIKLAKFHEAIPPLKKALEIDPSNARAEDLLDEAQAGARRLDYVSPKKEGNQANSNSNANSNSSANSNSAPSNTKPQTNANVKKVDIRPSRTNTNVNKPH